MWDEELNMYEAVWMFPNVAHVYRKLFETKECAREFLSNIENATFKDIRATVVYI